MVFSKGVEVSQSDEILDYYVAQVGNSFVLLFIIPIGGYVLDPIRRPLIPMMTEFVTLVLVLCDPILRSINPKGVVGLNGKYVLLPEWFPEECFRMSCDCVLYWFTVLRSGGSLCGQLINIILLFPFRLKDLLIVCTCAEV